MRGFVFLTVLILVGAQAQAQIDPSSALLLNSGRSAPVRESGIDSGRYTVRPGRSETVRQERPVRRPAPEVQSIEQTQEIRQEIRIESPAQAAAPVADPTPVPTAADTTVPDSFFVGPLPQQIPSQTVSQPAPDDRKSTMIELSIAPGYLYNDSSSKFTNRNYSLNSPAFAVDAGVWLAPSFGLRAGFLGTSNAHVSDSLANQRSVSVTEQWFKAGIRTRKFFGSTSLAPILTFGIDYQDYQVRVPSDSQMRAKLTSTGPSFTLESEIPSSQLTSWTLGVAFSPKLKHKEVSNDVDFSSGTSPSASLFAVSIGSKYRFDRSHTMFWKLSQSVEKNVFNGDSSVPDLESGIVQHGVSVTNTTTLFLLGYTWSD